jgi:putative transposase
MHSSHTQKKDIGKFLKKSIKKEFANNLPIPMAENCTYTKRNITNTVVFSISNNNFIEYSTKRLQDKKGFCPSSDTVFYHLNKLNENTVFSTFQQTNQTLLKQAKHQGVFDKPVWCGLDIHKIPWYGKKKDIFVLGMERVRGTSFGHGYASLECVNSGRRFTLSALPLSQFTTKKKIISFLVNETRKHVDISRLFLDREFFNIESINMLEELSILFVVPVKENKKISGMIKEFKQNCQKSFPPYETYYTLITRYMLKKGKDSATFTMVIVVESPEKPGDEWDVFAYATNIPVTQVNAVEIADSYRSRWGIETGYRVKENVRGKTCSPDYAIRLFLQLLSILLYNLWQLCNILLFITACWCKKGYVIILEEFKDIISDSIIGR